MGAKWKGWMTMLNLGCGFTAFVMVCGVIGACAVAYTLKMASDMWEADARWGRAE